MKELEAEKYDGYQDSENFKIDPTLKNIMSGFQSNRNKRIEEYNEKLNSQRITKERFFELILTIQAIYKKALEKGDNFEIWQTINHNGFNDNICLTSVRGYESKNQKNQITPFCLIGTEKENPENFNDCFFYDILYDPANPHNENYLVTPDDLFEDLNININGTKIELEDLRYDMPYLKKYFQRLDKKEVFNRYKEDRQKKYIKTDNETYEFIPDAEIKFNVCDRDNLEEIKNDIYYHLDDCLNADNELFIADNLFILEKNKNSVSLITNFDTLKVDNLKENIVNEISGIYNVRVIENYLMQKKPKNKNKMK